MDDKKGISLIVPVYNEEEAIPIFVSVIDKYALSLPFEIELIFVNDGSEDSSLECIKKSKLFNIKKASVVDLSKNFGFHAAARAGIENASYDICTWFGVDLQEPLEILPLSFERIASNRYDAVYFEKRTVKVNKINRLFSKIFSSLMKKYGVKTYSSSGTATVAFGKKIKKYLESNVEANSDLVLQILDAGFKFDTIPLDYNERSTGKSKWTLSKKIKNFIDSFVSFSYLPIRLVSLAGIFIFIIGLIIGIVTIVNRLVDSDIQTGYATIASMIALGFGVTNISLGIIAEYLWRTLDAAKKRPVYTISEVIDLKNPSV